MNKQIVPEKEEEEKKVSLDEEGRFLISFGHYRGDPHDVEEITIIDRATGKNVITIILIQGGENSLAQKEKREANVIERSKIEEGVQFITDSKISLNELTKLIRSNYEVLSSKFPGLSAKEIAKIAAEFAALVTRIRVINPDFSTKGRIKVWSEKGKTYTVELPKEKFSMPSEVKKTFEELMDHVKKESHHNKKIKF